jgi:pyruvate/2-oxoglutarate dehydrogenase complex dihydrolipoamide acyltransferase (E2) component
VIESLKIPALGELTQEVVIVEWLVAVGDTVDAGDPLVEVETDKVETQIDSPVAGVVRRLLAEPGAEVAVGSPYCEIET